MQERGKPRQFPLIGAFGLSLAVHLLLALVGPFVPVATHSLAQDSRDPDSEITFSFLDLPDAAADRPAADPVPDGNAEAPWFELPPGAAEAEPIPAEPGSDAPATPPPTLAPVPQEAHPAAPPLDAGASAPGAEDPAATPGAADRRLDVDRALREFGRVLAERPPTPRTPAAGSAGPSRNLIVPDLSTVPSSGFGMGPLHFESGDYDWDDYGRQIYFAIWRAWHRRLWQTTDEFEKWAHREGNWQLNHQNQIAFTIERSGQVTAVRLEGASGSPPLDRSALDALAEVILPPLPSDFPREREVVHARFVAIGDVPSMRPHLGRLKALGAF